MNVSMFSRIPNCWSIIVCSSLLGYIVFQFNSNQKSSGNFYRNRKTFAKHVSDKGLLYHIYKETYNLIIFFSVLTDLYSKQRI